MQETGHRNRDTARRIPGRVTAGARDRTHEPGLPEDAEKLGEGVPFIDGALIVARLVDPKVASA